MRRPEVTGAFLDEPLDILTNTLGCGHAMIASASEMYCVLIVQSH